MVGTNCFRSITSEEPRKYTSGVVNLKTDGDRDLEVMSIAVVVNDVGVNLVFHKSMYQSNKRKWKGIWLMTESWETPILKY